MNQRAYIRATGAFAPPTVVTNKDLEALMETSDEWIQQRSGIRERRWVQPGETQAWLALKASQDALAKANLKADDIDCIIYACLISDYVFPGGGVLLQKSLGCQRTIPALDIRNQCSGFLYGLSIADAWIRAGMYQRVLVVGAEIHSTSLDKTTRGRDIAVLFGDAAAAAIVERAPENSQSYLIDHLLYSEGEHAERLYVKGPSANDHPRVKEQMENKPEDIYPYMDGRFVFKNAVTRMSEALIAILEKNKVKKEDLKFVIAHQANMRINQMVLQQLGLPESMTHHTLDRYGNTTAATIPLTLNEAVQEGKIKRGDLIAFIGFGSGFTWGSSLLRY
ncbi:MAG: ketoacyl-ACP synthase III [Bdellovibrionales bacterium]|nr:ketoacyl-ACP synthase III [Bdellovibrionales bacterium]